jgi:hypothetical protein
MPMGTGSTEDLRAMIRAEGKFEIDAEMHEFYVADDLEKWRKRKTLVGNGQCPVVVQVATGAPKVKFWRRGPLVKGNARIPEGTAIATFDDKGRYPNKSHGNHAAIYLGQDAKGIRVLDQWLGKDVAKWSFERTLAFGTLDEHSISNNGNYFSVVVSERFHKTPYDMRECVWNEWR